jgi:hypothetical protein
VDLLVVLEGSKDRTVMEAVLSRPDDLGIQAIAFELEARSSGVRTKGPDVSRERRREFQFVVCLWDHKGSGREEEPASQAQGEVQNQLNRKTLKGCSKALVIDPEMEIWLWQDRTAIAKVLEVEEIQIEKWLDDWQRKQCPAQIVQTLVRQFPKEALEEVIQRVDEKHDSALYGRIAAAANFKLWGREPSFRRLQRTLRRWFPQRRG